jgi:hypothetical protein
VDKFAPVSVSERSGEVRVEICPHIEARGVASAGFEAPPGFRGRGGKSHIDPPA